MDFNVIELVLVCSYIEGEKYRKENSIVIWKLKIVVLEGIIDIVVLKYKFLEEENIFLVLKRVRVLCSVLLW